VQSLSALLNISDFSELAMSNAKSQHLPNLHHSTPVKPWVRVAAASVALFAASAQAQLTIGGNPLYLVSAKANVLMILDNSNSMDEAPNGAAVGSNSSSSKSEIARSVIRTMTNNYVGRLNLGLMAYRQNNPSASYIHNSPYDASFDPGHYDPAWTGARASPNHKRFRQPNPSSPGNFIYYNVALPFYAGANFGNAFCYSNTADATDDFDDGEDPVTGPWDTYRCFTSKTGTSNNLPTWGNAASEAANGWAGLWFQSSISPTDSDYAQGITDFGRFNTWSYVGRAWSRNDSPGRGYLHVPIKDLTTTQANNILAKLACNVPDDPAGCTSSGIKNAGLTPIEGTLLTARDYYKATTWTNADEGYTSSCYPMPNSCNKKFAVLLTDGMPSTSKEGLALTDPAAALTAAATAAAALRAEGVLVYVIGFALPYGVDPASLNTIAASGGTDTAYNAGDSATLTAAFEDIFADILRRSSSFGSVSQNSTSINTGSMIFQGRFDSTDWTGEVVAMRPTITGDMIPLWNASDAGRIPAYGSRKVFTMVPGVGGRAFKLLSDLSSAQQTALATTNCSGTLTGSACAQARIDYLRGDRSRETTAGNMRRRSRVHGDVISSSPYFVRTTNTLFVGANDGFLHAIDSSNGNELFAFMPSAALAKAYKLTEPSYAHDYYVDGEITVSTESETPGQQILVSTLGRGGKSLFALDVTTPSTFGASNVKWEFTDTDLGVITGKPVIAKLNNGVTAVIVGNGYNSTSNNATLFVINLDTGALIRKITVQAGGTGSATNGLSTPRGWDANGDGKVDILYAGDLQGNVWKFDFSSTTASVWASAYTSSGNPAPMFVALDSAGNRQPITGMIGLGINGRKTDAYFGKRYVFVGTGRYITTSDVTSTATQSWYGLIDDGAVIPNRAALRQRSIDLTGTIAGNSARAFSLPTAGDMAGKSGWYIDMVPPGTGATGGERLIGEQKFLGSVLIASSIVPNADACVPGGEGYINALDAFTGGSLTKPFFDVNNDLVLNDTDGLGTSRRVVGSLNPGINLPSDSFLIGNRLITSGTSGAVRSLSVVTPIRYGRITWREVVSK
jgi:type IV pilus assembly protein PilY1